MKSKRIHEMEQYIKRQKHVTLDELCEMFDVSKNTVRKDVTEIVAQPDFEKVYGGVKFVESFMPPFEERNQQALTGKKEIARRAALEVKERDIIFIDSGTTTQFIIDYLPENITLTIVTNSLIVINKAVSMPNVKLIIFGEIYSRNTLSFIGVGASDVLKKYNIHKAFMAASAASIASGLSNSDNQEYEIKSSVVSKAKSTYALVDHEKLGSSALVTYAQLDEIDVIITDQMVPEAYQTFAEENDIQIMITNQE